MSDEWVLHQVVQKLGGAKALLNLLPSSLVETALTGHHIIRFPLDLVAHVLSYIRIADVRNVLLTCKLFAKAIERKHFWHRMISQALDRHIEQLNIRDEQLLKFLKSIDMFECIEQQPALHRKDLLIWLFRHTYGHVNDWIEVHKTNRFDLVFQRRNSKHDWSHVVMQCKDGFKQILVRWYENNFGRCMFYSEKHKATFTGELAKNPNGGGLMYTFNIGPSGKWIFQDGTVLEGEGVAYNNEPRFSLQAGEWEHLLKRRKIGE